MSEEPTQPMDPYYLPPNPTLGWTYEVDLSRQTGANVYRSKDGKLNIYINSIWYEYDAENDTYWNVAWIPLRGED